MSRSSIKRFLQPPLPGPYHILLSRQIEATGPDNPAAVGRARALARLSLMATEAYNSLPSTIFEDEGVDIRPVLASSKFPSLLFGGSAMNRYYRKDFGMKRVPGATTHRGYGPPPAIITISEPEKALRLPRISEHEINTLDIDTKHMAPDSTYYIRRGGNREGGFYGETITGNDVGRTPRRPPLEQVYTAELQILLGNKFDPELLYVEQLGNIDRLTSPKVVNEIGQDNAICLLLSVAKLALIHGDTLTMPNYLEDFS